MIPTTTTSIVGNLTRDPELRFTPAGVPVATFGVAVNNRRRTEAGDWVDGDPQFFNITCWRTLAENVANSVEKGQRVLIVGRLNYRTWDTEDGDKRSAVEITADAVGPDLTWATAEVRKVTRRSPDQAPHPATEGPPPAPAPDPTEEPF